MRMEILLWRDDIYSFTVKTVGPKHSQNKLTYVTHVEVIDAVTGIQII